MSRLFYLIFFTFTLVAITNSFAKYQNIPLFAEPTDRGQIDEKLENKIISLTDKFDFLRQKSVLLDNSVDTNGKLRYLTHSDNFEEALFLIDYLLERFEELDLSNVAYKEVAVSDISFYIKRLEENLEIVERDLRRLSINSYEVSQK